MTSTSTSSSSVQGEQVPAETRILVANGVNLDLLGQREPSIYGRFDLASLEQTLRTAAPELARLTKTAKPSLVFYQSNDEGAFLAELTREAWDGLLINPGAWTHTSLALADRLAALQCPYAEVHISNIAARDEIRKQSYSAKGASGVVYGFGLDSYLAALYGLMLRLGKPKSA